MQFSSDIKIFHFVEAPEYLLLFSGERNILVLLHESFYRSIKIGDISEYDKSWFLMNDMVSDNFDKPFKDTLEENAPDISIPKELQKAAKRHERLFRDEYPTPDLDELIERIDAVITTFFPGPLKPVGPPARERLITSYRNIDRIVNACIYGKGPGPKGAFVKEAYLTIAAIRHIDDFIDEALWPKLSSFNPKELSELFSAFLNAWLQTVREFDPELPDDIIELCLLELDQVLNSSQENFEKNFRELFKRKSLDVFYVYQKIHNCVTTSRAPDILYKLGLTDYFRDFYKESIETDTDLSLYKYIQGNNLDPGNMVEFLIRLYNKIDPVGNRMAEKYISDQKTPIVIERQKSGILIFEPFPKVFARAITLLRRLEKKETPIH
jgi:hypothetical protein